jgi:hypothetical protein
MWAALLIALASPAWAGSCCGGSTPLLPAHVDRTESALFGMTADVSIGLARSDASGRVRPLSIQEQGLTWTGLVGWRWDPKGQISLTVPWVINHRASESLSSWGAQPGDVRVTALWEPLLESRAYGHETGAPVPAVAIGVRAPTGRPWSASEDPLGADITGGRDVGLSASVVTQRTTDDIPWSLSIGGELGLGTGDLAPALHAGAGVGGLLADRWTLSGSLSFEHSWARSTTGWTPSSHTGAQLQVTYSVFRHYRVWASVGADLPGLGREHGLDGHTVLGVAWVR